MIRLICAEDDLLADELVQKLRSELPKGAETLTLAPEAGDLPGLEQALFAPSLFATDRLVVVREAELLKSSGLQRLAAAAQRGGLVGTLAVVAVGDRPPAGLVRSLQGLAKVHRLPRPRRGDLAGWVSRRMKTAEVTPGRDVPGTLVETVGTNLRDLAQAIDQLATRVGRGGAVQREDVTAHFGGLAEQPMWALFDALTAGDGRKAFRVLHSLLSQGEDPIAILFAVVSQVRHVMRAKSALERTTKLNDEELARALAVSQGRSAVLRRQAAKLSWEWLLRVHRMCADADFDLKGGDEVRIVGVLPPGVVLERLIDQALPATEIVPG